MTKRNRILAAAAVAVCPFIYGNAHADIMTPAGLTDGDSFYMVFVSTTQTNANSSDPTGYNSLVAGDAATAGVDTYNGNPVTWQALASYDGGPDAISLFNPSAPIYLVDGTQVAPNGTALWGGTPLENPIDETAGKTIVDPATEVWTGTNADGSADEALPAFSKAFGPFSPNGASLGTEFGVAGATDSTWISSDSADPNGLLPVYAFSSELTVPEPATLGLLAVGLLATSRRIGRHSSSRA